MPLNTLLTQRREAASTGLPTETHAAMMKATKDLQNSKMIDNAPKVGDKLAVFNLPNQTGEQRQLTTLLESGPVVITFYRGGWCPYCNFELQAYQDVLSDIQNTGATLIAITPELPDASLSTTEKNKLGFEVLSDEGSLYARQLGLVFTLPDEIKPIYEGFGINLEQHNGEGQFDLPLAATFVVNQEGIIHSAFVDVDYTQRREPSEIVTELQSLVK
ncbi:MAG: peroxiredoxin-like family protein [Oceanospirillaceae bacterium]